MTKNVRFAFIQKETAVLLGSKRKFAKHGKCGMELSDFLPHLGECADDICLVRSMHTDAFNHHPAQLMMMSGVPRFGRPSMGSWLTYGLGSESENLPGYVVLTAGRGGSGGVSNWTSGFLPSTYQGVLFRDKGDPVLNLANPPGVSTELQGRSLDAIASLNRRHLETPARPGNRQPHRQLRAGVPHAVGRAGADRSVAGNASHARHVRLRPAGADRRRPAAAAGRTSSSSSPATACSPGGWSSAACGSSRMVHASWDHHSNLDEELGYCARMADQPLAALLKDLKQRGLLDSTLLVFAGEFGRTPLGENRDGKVPDKVGRDHHPFAFSLWMAGGGFKGGLTYGKTDDIGWSVVENPVHVNDLHATILHLFGFDHRRLAVNYKGLSVRLTDQGGKVVDDLLA